MNDFYILFGLGSTLECQVIDREPGPTIVIGSEEYSEIDDLTWCGFYDWLRRKDGRIVGVRLWPWKETDWIFHNVSDIPYANAKPQSVEVMFEPSKQYDTSLSDDQDLLFSKVYRSADNRPALAFRCKDMPQEEEQQLMRLCNR